MRTEPLFGVGGMRLRFAPPGGREAGNLLSCTSATADLLTGGGHVSARSGGQTVRWQPARMVLDADEVEVTCDSDAGIRVMLRHSFAVDWGVRLLVLNTGRAAVTLEEVTLTWWSAPATITCAYAAGAEAGYTVQPATGDGPVLSGRLTSGAQRRVTRDGLELGSLRLGPGERHVVQWRWEVVAGPADVPPPDAVPAATWLDSGQAVTLDTGPDVAVLAPGLEQAQVAGGVELHAAAAGTYPVELRSARGTTSFGLRWAPGLQELVAAAATAAMAGSRHRSGAIRLADPAVGIVIQQALDRSALGGRADAQDALDLLAGEVSEGPGPDPLGLAFLAREADRSGDPTLLDRAYTGLLATRTAAPGVGLAAALITVASIRAGRPAGALTQHLASLGSWPARGPAGGGALEAALLAARRDAGTPGAALRRLGATLGSGLPGELLPPPELDRLAHLAGVLTLLDDAAGAGLASWWGIGAAELARRSAAQARARIAAPPGAVDDEPVRLRALAWLVLGAAVG